MKKIAIISDIHANLPALEAVLEDIREDFKADQIYCLGDLTDGAPWVNEVIELIRVNDIPTIMGNHDERIAFNHEVYALKKHTLEEQNARFETINQTKINITGDNQQYLLNLNRKIRFDYAGIHFLLVHGSPDSNRTYVYEDHPSDKASEMFNSATVDVIVCGHTHVSYARTLKVNGVDKLLVNAGSVGRSKEQIGGKAVYVQLRIDESGKSLNEVVDVSFRKIDYNIHKTIDAIKNSDTPDFYARFLLKSIGEL